MTKTGLLSSLGALAAFLFLASACEPTPRPQAQGAAQGEDDEDHDHDHGEHPEKAPPQEALSSPQSVGGPVSEDVELVNASELISDPERFAGKTVRIRGQVNAFCHHRRAWFSIAVPGANPPYLRVLTAPAFQVPPGIMNARGTAVGTVEVIDVPRSRASHYEREHKLPTGDPEGTGALKRAVLRATGASFEPAAS